MTSRRAILIAFLALFLVMPTVASATTSGSAVVSIGRSVRVDEPVERVVVVGGDVDLGPNARVTGEVVVLFGALRRAPGATIDGSSYVVSRRLVDWIPGPGWVVALVVAGLIVAYRIAVWAAVQAIAAALVRSATFERWSSGWARPLPAITVGLITVVIALPVLAIIAITGFLLPLALIGLAGLLVSAGAGLAFFREGPVWPRRPSRWAYAAFLVLPPALEIGLLISAAGGLGSGILAVQRNARRRQRE